MISQYRKKIDVLTRQLEHHEEVVVSETKKASDATLKLETQKQAIEIVQAVAAAVEQAVHNKIASVVTKCMEAVLDDPYEFCITFERKRNRTEATLSFKRDDLEVDPMSAAGGGAVDVAAFALRVACLSLSKEALPLIVLDEPFKFLSKDKQHRLAPLINELSERLDIQFIIVTHLEKLRCGKVVELSPS